MGPHNIGSIVKGQAAIPPGNAIEATVNGAAIDRLQFGSCVLHAACGAATGAPSAQSVNVKLQDSPDGTNDWLDITGAAVAALVANDTESQVDVNLLLVRKYIRVVRIVDFTGGTSPAIPVSTTLILGGARSEPI
jgi:hypothetical protein